METSQGRPSRFGTLAIVILALTSCEDGEEMPQPAVEGDTLQVVAGPVLDAEALADTLRAAGLSVEAEDTAQQPFFDPPARVFAVDGEQLQVFEYPDSTEAVVEETLVSRDGTTIGQMTIEWIAPPHFYRQGRLIALYLGENQAALEALEATLGPPFAGRSPGVR